MKKTRKRNTIDLKLWMKEREKEEEYTPSGMDTLFEF